MATDDIYIAAASIIDSALKKEGSLKHLCYSNKYKNKKKLFALVFETVKCKKLLEKVADECELFWDPTSEHIGPTLKLILLYETVLGRGVPPQSRFHEALNTHHASIVDVFLTNSQRYPHLAKESKSRDLLPRYVRVNTLKLETTKAIEIFENEGYRLIDSKNPNELSSSEFRIDNHIPDLLVFSSETDLHTHALYKEGKILLQDKASCLPAYILDPPPNSYIIDACAAPGNKSSHLASIIKNEGHIYSFDRDKERFDIMNKLLRKANATCIKTVLKDFLKVKHESVLFSKVEYVLVDPSCSGSGIVSRMDDLVDDDISDAKQTSRLKGLAGFQTAALSHSLTFPNAKRVVYSTCSIHKEENEDVVEKAAKRFSSTFRLVHILPEWKNRGLGEWPLASKCIRAVPETDHTNGFFVALFERISESPKTIEVENVVTPIEIKTICEKQKNKKAERKKKRKENETPDSGVVSPFCAQAKKRKKTRIKRPVTS